MAIAARDAQPPGETKDALRVAISHALQTQSDTQTNSTASSHQTAIKTMEDAKKTAVENLKADHATALKRMEEQNKTAIEDLKAKHANAIMTLEAQTQTTADAAKATYEAASKAEQEQKEKAQRATDAANQTITRLRDQLRRARATNELLLQEVIGRTLPPVVSTQSRQVEGLVTRSGGTVLGRETGARDDSEDGKDEVKQEELKQDAMKQDQDQE